RIFRDGRRVALPMLALHWRSDANPARLGLAVSRQADPHAVGRNRIKRTVREHFRELRSALAAGGHVPVARPPAASPAPAAPLTGCTALLRRAGALPHPAADGTMPAADSRPAFPPSPDAPCSSGE